MVVLIIIEVLYTTHKSLEDATKRTVK